MSLRAMALASVVAIISSIGWGQALAQTKTFRTSSGQVLVFQNVESLDCAGILGVLNKLDASGYRARGQTSFSNELDAALFNFEDEVARLSAKRRCWAVQKPQSFGRFSTDKNIPFGQ